MEQRRYYWLKLKDDFFDEKYIKALRRLPSGDSLIIVYLKMQLNCLKTNGLLSYDGVADSMEEELALILDEDINVVRLTLTALENLKLIEKKADESIFMIGMPIGMIGSESSVAERVRKHREKKKEEERKLLQCNTYETNSNTDIDINIEIEKEIDKELEKEINIELDLETEQDINHILKNLIELKLLSDFEIQNNPYKELIFKHSNHLTYGLVQSIAIYVLTRLPNNLPSRYKLFERAFNNKVRETLILNAKQNINKQNHN